MFTQAVIQAHARRRPLIGNHLFGKASCPHCTRARCCLETAGIDYVDHDVVREPRAFQEMLARVKPLVGPRTPITVPRGWLEGTRVGAADELSQRLERSVEPNPERGRCSPSPGRGGARVAETTGKTPGEPPPERWA